MSMSDRQLRQIRPRVQPQADPKNTSSGALELWPGLRVTLPLAHARRAPARHFDVGSKRLLVQVHPSRTLVKQCSDLIKSNAEPCEL